MIKILIITLKLKIITSCNISTNIINNKIEENIQEIQEINELNENNIKNEYIIYNMLNCLINCNP